jgi:hypothetical protein
MNEKKLTRIIFGPIFLYFLFACAYSFGKYGLTIDGAKMLNHLLMYSQRALLFLLGVVVGVALYVSHKSAREKRNSRKECLRAFETLHEWFSQNALDSENLRECARLLLILDKELCRHIHAFPDEIRRADVSHWRRYAKEAQSMHTPG